MTSHADRLKVMNGLALRRAARKAGGKRRRLRKPGRLLFPAGAERSYLKSIRNIITEIRSTIDKRVIPELAHVVARAQAARPTADHARADDYGDAIANLMELVRSEFFGRYDDDTISEMVRSIAEAVAAQNGGQITKVFSDVLGVDVFKAEPWLSNEISAFVTSNVSLIKSLSAGYFDRIENIVYQGARSGQSWQDIADDLRGAPFGASRARAELIARDQVGKFNGQLTMLRQTQAGVSRYTWRTSHDERVRASHRRLDGKVFSWSDPPLVDGRRQNPGEPIQCRCFAEPLLDDLLDGGDSDEA